MSTQRKMLALGEILLAISVGLFIAAIWSTGNFWPDRLAGTGTVFVGCGFILTFIATMP
jgi:hypothetical protein